MDPRHLHHNRRTFLKAAGVSMALPMLESLTLAKASVAPAQRLVCVGGFLGFHQASIFPKKAGRDYEMSTLLGPVAKHRRDFTIFSGLDHRAPNGHGAWSNYLCGQDPSSVSLDQIVAEQIGQESRFPSVQLTAGKASRSMSFTRQGIPLPMIQRPSVFYRKLFASAEDRAHREYLLKSGQSALDLTFHKQGDAAACVARAAHALGSESSGGRAASASFSAGRPSIRSFSLSGTSTSGSANISSSPLLNSRPRRYLLSHSCRLSEGRV